MKTALVTVQRKGVINIPAEIRTELGLEHGDKMEASLQRGRIVLVKTSGRKAPQKNAPKKRPGR